MISTALTISIIVNAILITVTLFGILEIKKIRGHLFRKDTFIKVTKNKLQHAQQEIYKEKSKGSWATQFFTEEDFDNGLFSKNYIIKFKFQLLHNGYPVGPAGLLAWFGQGLFTPYRKVKNS